MPEQTKKTLALGDSFWRFFRQTGFEPVSPELQAILISAICLSFWDGKNAEIIAKKALPEKESFLRELIDGIPNLYSLNVHLSKKEGEITKLLKQC